jgi:hypothetical protein
MPSKQRRRTPDETDAPTDAEVADTTAKPPSGRTTPKGAPSRPASKVGRPKTAQESGRYTPPIPRSVRKSSRLLGVSIIVLLLAGVLTVLLNYLNILPGGTSVWYLLGGLGTIFVGSMMATRYH